MKDGDFHWKWRKGMMEWRITYFTKYDNKINV